MAQYLSPGVYVEEIPSAVQAIAGVGTSTAGFIGVIPDNVDVPVINQYFSSLIAADASMDVVPRAEKLVGVTVVDAVKKENTEVLGAGKVVPDLATALAIVDALTTVNTDAATGIKTKSVAKLKIKNARVGKVSIAVADVGDVKLCTNFGDFRRAFGDFSADEGQRILAHAVYGFFDNGGTRCYVARVTTPLQIQGLLEQFAAIDEIALVAAPGITDAATRAAIVSHCAVHTQDRFAILDSEVKLPDDDLQNLNPGGDSVPDNSDYAAFYFPWIQVSDPVTQLLDAKADPLMYVPPSGHVAGIYARTDTTRGVFKAPANAQVMGALGLKYQISKAQQDGLNPQGVNCIRDLNGNIRVWGARTIGGDANGEWRYINVRRTFLFLRESIDEGMQWAVFEPNDQSLWAKITRNITAFLMIQWRAGALFGATPQEAFYVKCDAETNPPELREIGQVVTEIGVAVVRPAEFVIFRISQWQPPQK